MLRSWETSGGLGGAWAWCNTQVGGPTTAAGQLLFGRLEVTHVLSRGQMLSGGPRLWASLSKAKATPTLLGASLWASAQAHGGQRGLRPGQRLAWFLLQWATWLEALAGEGPLARGWAGPWPQGRAPLPPAHPLYYTEDDAFPAGLSQEPPWATASRARPSLWARPRVHSEPVLLVGAYQRAGCWHPASPPAQQSSDKDSHGSPAKTGRSPGAGWL